MDDPECRGIENRVAQGSTRTIKGQPPVIRNGHSAHRIRDGTVVVVEIDGGSEITKHACSRQGLHLKRFTNRSSGEGSWRGELHVPSGSYLHMVLLNPEEEIGLCPSAKVIGANAERASLVKTIEHQSPVRKPDSPGGIRDFTVVGIDRFVSNCRDILVLHLA